MDAIIKKYLYKLKEFNSLTPVYFKIEEPLEILCSYDKAELYKIIQFDTEIKNILEPFLYECYIARVLYDNIDFIKLEKFLQGTVTTKYFLREIQLLDILRTISLYYDFIELKTDASLYYQNIQKITKVLSEVLYDIESIRDEVTDSYAYSILSENLEMLNDDILNNKITLKKAMKKILLKVKNIEFSDFSLLITVYCLAIFNQEKLLDSICYINNIYEFILYYNFNNKISKNIVKKYSEFIHLVSENQKIQERLYSGQNNRSLI